LNGLVLIPTRLELQRVESELRPAAERWGWSVELCGFGLVASASRSAELIERYKPKQVLLLGIAGAYDDAIPIGTATSFHEVCCYGVGVGSGGEHQTAREIGFQHWNDQGVSIDDCLQLTTAIADGARRDVLLTCAAASASENEATEKRNAVPAATAEDMEGFSVAFSCRLADLPLTIIRGISNRVGDRHHRGWQIDAALRAAAKLATDHVIGGSRP
jgi:futalosine hydrolase